MMKARFFNISKWTYCLFLTSFLSFSAHAGQQVENLSPELRELLQKEMRLIENGMNSIFSAYISGDFQEVERIAQEINYSFILKQEITQEQLKELKSTMPKGFLKMDRNFHEYAGELAKSANKGNKDVIGFYYSKMTESCVACHSHFASHRFPSFQNTESKGHHH